MFLYSQLIYSIFSSPLSTLNIGFDNCKPKEPKAPLVTSFSCGKTVVDIVTGLITIHVNWTHEHVPLIQEAIEVYNIVFNAKMEGPGGSEVIIVGNNIPLSPDPDVPAQVICNTLCCIHR